MEVRSNIDKANAERSTAESNLRSVKEKAATDKMEAKT